MKNHTNVLRGCLLAMVAYLVGEGIGVVILAMCLDTFGADVMRSMTAVPFVIAGAAAGCAAIFGYGRKERLTPRSGVLIALIVPVLISLTMVVSATVGGSVNAGNVALFVATQIASAALAGYASLLLRARRTRRKAQSDETPVAGR